MIEYTNPVYPHYFADPFVWRYEGIYYAVGTGPGLEKDGANRFPLLRSRDLVNWEPLGHALVGLDAKYGNSYWAPEVAYSGGKFFLYYSAGHGDKGHHLRVAVSEQPDGPYEDVGEPVNDPSETPFAIDAHPFRDDDGTWYLFHARDFLDRENGYRVGTGLVVDRLINMTKLAGEENTVARASRNWQRFMADRPIYGGIYDWHTLEGPAVLKHDGKYYCFYSGGCWQNDTYGVDYVTADAITGPYTDSSGEDGARVLRSIPEHVIGPGHNSFTTGPDQSEFIVYHAWDIKMTARRMCIDRIVWTAEGPRCQGPAWELQTP